LLHDALPAWDRFQGEPHSFSNLAGTVYFHFDMEAFDFHLDVAPGADPKDICTAVTQAEWWGLELMDDDECEPELLEGGRTRRYLTPIVPAEVMEAEAVADLIAEAEVVTEAEIIAEVAADALPVAKPGFTVRPRTARALGFMALLPMLPLFTPIVGVS